MKTSNLFYILYCLLLVCLCGCVEYPAYVTTRETFVDKTSLEMYIGDEAQLTASPSDAVYRWSSNNEAAATVNQTGKVTAVGEGLATITVASEGDEKHIDVNVKTFIALDDISLTVRQVSLLVNQRIQIWAYPVPENASEYHFTWTSDNAAIATVNEDGIITPLSGGLAQITVTSGEIEKTVSVIVLVGSSSLLNSALGYWKFDDPANLGKATRGVDLTIQGAVSSVEGPTSDNFCIQGSVGERNLLWHHGQSRPPGEYTILWDAQFPAAQPPATRQYYASFWNGNLTLNDASQFFRWDNNELQYGQGSYVKAVEYTPDDPAPWLRMALVVTNEGNNYSVYCNGVKFINNVTTDPRRTLWDASLPLYFLSDGDGSHALTGGDGDDGQHPLAALAVWNRALIDEEIALLGEMEIPRLLSKVGWTVEVSDEQASDGGGKNTMIDGDYSNTRYWHSQWSTPAPLPHWAVIDMKAKIKISSIVTQRRSQGYNRTLQYFIGNTPDVNATDWVLIAEGFYDGSSHVLTLNADNSIAGQYLKLVIPDSNNGTNSAICEIDVYGTKQSD